MNRYNMPLNILATQYSLINKSYEIYKAGCSPPHCKGCFSQETWDYNQGTYYKDLLNEIKKTITENNEMINNIWILGGEPTFCKKEELIDFIDWLKQFNKPIWLFTRLEIDEVDKDILDRLDYIKTGKYDNSKLSNDNVHYQVKLASSNQKIYKLR